MLYFVFYYITGYRKKVIFDNLTNSFPEKSPEEIKAIAKEFYKHMADLMLESIKSFSMSEKELVKRYEHTNIDYVEDLKAEGKNLVVVLGHYTNWEWFGLSGSYQVPPQIYTLYKKIKNIALNDLIANNRQRFGLGLIPEKEAFMRINPLLSNEEEWCAITFLADQSAKPKRAYWVDFLNQKTTFFKGAELYAKKNNCPVIYARLEKLKRGHYRATFEKLVDNPNDYEEGEIIKLYAQKLEEQIQEAPAYWLWSHKRWKYQFED